MIIPIIGVPKPGPCCRRITIVTETVSHFGRPLQFQFLHKLLPTTYMLFLIFLLICRAGHNFYLFLDLKNIVDQTLGIIHQAWSNAGHKIRGTGHDFHRTTIFSLLKREMSKIKIKFLNSSFYFSLKFPDSFWSSRIPHVDDDQPLQKHDQLL